MIKSSSFQQSLIMGSILALTILGSFCSNKSEVTEMPWQPVEGKIMTQWAEDITPGTVHPEYPRPQMIREEWVNMNGMWEYAIRPEEEEAPEQFDGFILVPFPVESALSGVKKPVGKENRL